MILIYCEYASGSIALDACRIDGLEVASRYYEIADHYVEVDGGGQGSSVGGDVIAVHDAEILVQMHGYRLATGLEQDAYLKAKNNTGSLVENVEEPAKQGRGGRSGG